MAVFVANDKDAGFSSFPCSVLFKVVTPNFFNTRCLFPLFVKGRYFGSPSCFSFGVGLQVVCSSDSLYSFVADGSDMSGSEIRGDFTDSPCWFCFTGFKDCLFFPGRMLLLFLAIMTSAYQQGLAGFAFGADLMVHQMPHSGYPLRGAYHFFEFTSFKIEMSRVWSGMICLSRRFSSSSCFILKASFKSIPSYLLRHQ